ncbi:MAG: 5-oxoprolinase subunit PxpB [Woeseiaceae bacterium]|nr:5-oxoprolinase subunit PxpB [Woeseiaceae bacterium]
MKPARLLSDDLVEMEFPSQAFAEAVASRMREEGGWLEVVTGIDTLTVQFDCLQTEPDQVLERLSSLSREAPEQGQRQEAFELPVCYSPDIAPDLESVCQHLNIDVDALIRLHTATEHEVRLLGFAPGFVYIDGLDSSLNVPRHEIPRQSVPAGSVAIAGSQTGIYSLASPGGWQVIGRTPVALFDPAVSPPNLLQPGRPIRFRPISVDEYEALMRP